MKSLLLIICIALLASPAFAAKPVGKVGVWYITLFYPKGQGPYYWDSVVKRGGAMPSGGAYVLSDPGVIARQIREMKACGIDFILMDDTNTVHVDNDLVDKNIRAWYDFMDKLPEKERIPIAIAAGGELNQHHDRQAWTQAVDYLWQSYAQRPSYLREQGKPVLHWYIEGKCPWPEWSDSRWTIHQNYHFFWTTEQITHGGWGYGAASDVPVIAECMSLHPGWDLSPPGIAREGGEHYRREWVKILKGMPRHVLISDWNGWHEGTAIEDSDSWKGPTGETAPSWYRVMTQGYAAAYKGKLVDGLYYRDESGPHVYRWKGEAFEYQGAYPKRAPVIVLPKGLLQKLAGKKPIPPK